MTNLNEIEKMKRELYFASFAFHQALKYDGKPPAYPAAEEARRRRFVGVWNRCEELGLTENECHAIYLRALEHTDRLKGFKK